MSPEESARASVVLAQTLISLIVMAWAAGAALLWWLEDRWYRKQR